METAALPVNMFLLPLRAPCANGCVMCVRAARSDVSCPARISNQTMDLLLQAERTPSTQKAFISLLGLILHPRREEQEANEYRGGNVSLQGAASSTPSNAPYLYIHIRFIVWTEAWMQQHIHKYTALSLSDTHTPTNIHAHFVQLNCCHQYKYSMQCKRKRLNVDTHTHTNTHATLLNLSKIGSAVR